MNRITQHTFGKTVNMKSLAAYAPTHEYKKVPLGKPLVLGTIGGILLYVGTLIIL